MDIQVEKLKLIEWVAKLQDVDIVETLKQIQIGYENKSVSAEEWESINRGMKDFDEGRIHEHDSVRKLYEKYL